MRRDNGSDVKRCETCKKTLPVSEFYSNGEGGFKKDCKPCHRATDAYKKRLERNRKQNKIRQQGEHAHASLDTFNELMRAM